MDCKYFSDEDKSKNLTRRTLSSGAIVLASQVVRTLIQFISTYCLARLLNPSDFGLIAMVAVITSFLVVFRDLGLTQATIQKKDIDHQSISNLFWVNLGVSVVVAIIPCVAAPILVAFFNRQELMNLVIFASCSLLVEGVSLQHRALMMRKMEFLNLSIIETIANLTSTVLAVGAAVYGVGYWALIIQSVSCAFVNSTMTIVACGWRPSLYNKNYEIRSYIQYGKNLAAFNALNYFSRNGDNFIIGRWCGAEQLGLYGRAYQLLLLPISQINAPMTKVMLPTLSRLQGDSVRYRSAYIVAVRSATFLSIPIMGFASVFSPEIIEVILGRAWLETVPIFVALLPAAFVCCLNITTGWVFQSLGTVDRQVKWTLFAAPFNIVAMLIGLQWGAIGVAWAISSAFVIVRIPYLIYTYKGTSIRMRDLASALMEPAIVTLIVALIFATLKLMCKQLITVNIISLSVIVLAYMATYLIIDQLMGRRSTVRYLRARFEKEINQSIYRCKQEDSSESVNN